MASGLQPQVKLWLERDGRVAFSDYRARLLRLIDETGSLAQAAARMKLSYRRAWGKVRELEQNLGVELVASDVGGSHGGGSHLTPAGRDLLDRYDRFSGEVREAARRAFEIELRHRRPDGSGEIGEQVEPVADHTIDAAAHDAIGRC